MVALMVDLWRLEAERPDKPCSLARLSKQTGLPMSALRRQLTVLEAAGLVTLVLDDGGITGTVHFSADGRALAADMMA